MAKTPLTLVKEKFETKEKLVAAVAALATKELWLDRVSEDKGLSRISNAKLLRLHASLEDAKKRFGSRDGLISAIVKLENRAKDSGYNAHLAKYPLPRLIDIHDSTEKRIARAVASAAKKATRPQPAVAKRKTRTKKAKAKAAAAQ